MIVQDARPAYRSFTIVRLLAIVVCVCACAPAAFSAEPITLRLRMQWGNGVERAWKATVRVGSGSISEPQPLARHADAPGSIWMNDAVLHIQQPSPQQDDGVEFQVQADAGATLSVEMAPADQPTASRSLEIPLAKLLDDPSQIESLQLDEQGNSLTVNRAPGDRLRVAMERQSLIYWTGENLSFRVLPSFTGLRSGSEYRLTMQLRHARGGAAVWQEEQDLEIDDQGTAAATEMLTTRLDQEGVYDLVVAVTKKRGRLSSPLRTLPQFLSRPPKAELERTVQLVVIDSKAPPVQASEWRLESEIDPTNTRWWESVIRLPQWRVFAQLRRGQLGNAKPAVVQQVERRFSQLETDGWQAYPLTVRTPGKPHLLEIDYPASHAQLLSISIIESTNAVDSCASIDSGIHVPDQSTDVDKVVTHRITFWPQTKSPLVLLTNRHTRQPAVFGKLRVYSGPSTLPPATDNATVGGDRLVAACFDQPLFPQNFGASPAYDNQAARSIVDWQTFYLGTQRLIDYLKHAGYNGAFVPVLCEGGTIYPSALLQPNARYDSGRLATNGQDPTQKDVVELMFRLFDREGLRLVPVIQFTTPLPELEAKRRLDRINSQGIMLVGSHGRNWVDTHPRAANAPRYNPLDGDVQRAMQNVTDELLTRYSQHNAFTGIAWQIDSNSYTQFPDSTWACDDETVTAFLQTTKLTPPNRTGNAFQDRALFLSNEGRQAWLEWRSQQLTAFYNRVGKDIRRRSPNARLFLTSQHLLQGSAVEPYLRPQLPPKTNERETLLRLGIDVQRIQGLDSTVLFEPTIVAPGESISTHAAQLAFQQQFAGTATGRPSGAVIHHEASSFTLPQYDQLSPFGAKASTTFVPHAVASQHYARRPWIDTLKRADRRWIVNGGKMLPLGQEEALLPLLRTVRELPPVTFQDVAIPTAPKTIQPLTVRAATHNGYRFVYLLNDSAWPVSVNVRLAASPLVKLEPLGGRSLQPLKVTGSDVEWPVLLEPFDMVAVRCQEQLGVTKVSVTSEQRVFDQLSTGIKTLRARVLASDQTSDEINVANASFEQDDAGIPGWIHTPLPPDNSFEIRSQQNEDGHGKGLKLTSRGPVVWVRSEPIATPKLGRLKLSARLRTSDTTRQPPLRLAIQGTLDGKEYYRYAQVGAGPPGSPQLTAQWREFEILFDYLPLQELTDLRIGFDLMGPGEVWIDDVRVKDTWFRQVERDELLKNVALARFHLEARQVSDCESLLDNYWSRFLHENVDVDVVAVKNTESRAEEISVATPAAPEDTPAAATAKKRNGLRAWLPKFFR